MIRFQYKPISVRGTRGNLLETVYRPMIPIIAIGPGGSHDLRGLVDTGADDTLFPDRFLDKLGISLDPADHSIIVGIDGSMTVVRYGIVDLELPGAGGGYRWSSRVGFHAGNKIALGHNGFLEYFTASFNGRSRHVTLTPNGKAPAPTSA